MTKITAAEVNQLRKQTGLGMMDCKNALVEAEGDFDKAIEILRKKGQKVAAKRGDRDANQGLVIAKTLDGGKKGIIVVVNCETDFVAKNDNFIDFANNIANTALNSSATSVDELKGISFNGNGTTVGEALINEIAKIGEKIDVSGFGVVEAETVVAYNHPGNQVASVVGLNLASEAVSTAGKDVAMQTAAMAPVAVDENGVAEDIIAKEMEIGREQAREEGKPEAILDKIANGKVKKFLKENTLLNQAYIKDNKKSVGQYLKEVDGSLTVTDFKRYALGS